MITFKNTRVYKDLVNHKYDSDDIVWAILWGGDINDPDPVIDMPWFQGGLDHVEFKRNRVIFHDIGCNEKNNTFQVKKDD